MSKEEQTDKHYNWLEIETDIINNNTNYSVSNNINTNNYSIIMPPPNVTGSLHLGHALDTTLQDALARHYRMLKNNVLWQPGLDHAGIATQMLVERKLNASGIKRTDLSREDFIKKVFEWKEEFGSTIVNQIKRLGSSADFSYLAFTMDEQSTAGVMKAFVELYKEGLIYQDSKLVNWDYKLQTAISDLEVVQKEVSAKMYYIKYTVENEGIITIATTRPETLFADSAIAVNPKDDRYTHLIGKTALIPISNKKIPIIADTYVDINKGTGALKVTPAHDFNDFEIGERHNLDKTNLLNENGTLNNNAPTDYIGLTVLQAREKIILQLKSLNILSNIEDITTTIPYGDRTDVIIEPRITKQWFVDAKKLSIAAIKAVKNKDIIFYPNNWENLYFDWMENIKPWCISRQLWWGHRIPVWYGPDNKKFVAINYQEAYKEAETFYGKPTTLIQDNDVLDTWFSSGLWPFVTLGWPNNTTKLQQFYPTSVLITGFDIIFFWVARMIMLGLFFTKQVPFKHIYIHGLIKDENGQKMSKSKGNTIDPLVLMNKFGTDAVRFALFSYSGQGRDIIVSENIIAGYRNYITKIFNAFKFAKLHNLSYNPLYNPNHITLDVNKWILFKVYQLQNNVFEYYNTYKFSEIGNAIYKTIWAEFCDWYIELIKPILFEGNAKEKLETQETLAFVFTTLLKIIHPIAPFISQHLYKQIDPTVTDFNKFYYNNLNYQIEQNSVLNIDLLINFITKIRALRTDFNISYNTELNIYFKDSIPSYVANNLVLIKKIVKIKNIIKLDVINTTFLQEVVNQSIIAIDLTSSINVKEESNRLQQQLTKLNTELEKINTSLLNPKFLQNAGELKVNEFTNNANNIKVKIQKTLEILNKLT